MNQLSPSLMNRCSIKEVEFGPKTEAPTTKSRNAKVLLLGASDSGKSTVVKQVRNLRVLIEMTSHKYPLFWPPPSHLQANTPIALNLEAITIWLRQSGVRVNEDKTDICLFQRNYQPFIPITLNNVVFTSKKSITVGRRWKSRLITLYHYT